MTEASAPLFWRRDTSVTPGVMTLSAGTLSFVTERETVFRAGIADVDASFSTFSTLTIAVPGARHDFVTGAHAKGEVANTPGRVVGLFQKQSDSFAAAKAWAETLRDAGVRVRMRGTTFARSQVVVAAIVVPSLAAVGFLAWWLQVAF